jgi:sugar phosphate isomerase/epimerase
VLACLDLIEINRRRCAKSLADMKIAFHMHAVRGHFRNAFPTESEQAKVFEWVAREGFAGIDISDSWGFEHLDVVSARSTLRLARARGLQIPTISCMGKTLCHPTLRHKNLEALEAALDVASNLDARLLNVALSIPRTPGVMPTIGARHSPGGSAEATDADFELTVEGLRRVARLAAPRGIDLSIEMHDRALADTSTSLLRILTAIGEANVGANPDLCNGYRAYEIPSETWQQALGALAPHANLWHVNNMQRVHFPEIARAAFVERSLGEGDVDYRVAVNMMKAAGFDGWIVVEYKGTGDAFETLRRSKAYLDTIMA